LVQFRASRRDARDLKNTLISHGWNENNIRVLIEEQATKQAILDTFTWLNQSDADDVIFFYSGTHGYYMEDQPPLDEPDNLDEFIMPFDCDWETDDNCLLDDELADEFDKLQSQNIAIAIESCHSGGMLDGSQDLPASGRVILTGCGTDELGCPLRTRMYWLFCYYLIKAFRGRADKNNDNWISLEETYQYTNMPVMIRSTLFNLLTSHQLSTQHPQIYDGWPTEENNQADLQLINLKS